MDRTAFEDACRGLNLPLTRDQIQAFFEFEEKLYLANETMNLTRVPREECWTRHFLDCLIFQDLIAPGSKVLDIGTGPGFPAWPLACARPDLKVTALDSSGKMTAFLKARSLPNLRVVVERAEDWSVRDHFDVVTGRALAPLATQLELSAQPCKVHGLILPMRTPADETVLEDCGAGKLGLRLKSAVLRTIPPTDIERMIPIYEKVVHTPSKYPRRWAEMKLRPMTGL